MATPDWFPSTSDWKSWTVPAFPPALTTAVQTVGSVTGAITSALTVVKTALSALSELQLQRVDLTQAAVTAAVTAIELALKSLESDTGVYVLLVPPRRRVIVPTVVQAALTAAGLPSIPPGKTDLKILELQTQVAKQGVDQAVISFMRQATSANGGSAGFLRTVLESLTDRGDPNRPQLAPTDAVAGGILLSGAPDYATLLSFLMAVDSLVGPKGATTALNAPDIPTPQDLRIQKLAAGAQLTWRPRPAVVDVPALGSAFLLTEVAVIRSTDASLMAARTPMDVFGTTQLREGLKQGNAEVIKLRQNISAMTTYLDETVALTSEPYYYALSYHITDLDGVDKGFGPMSNVTKLVYGTARAGTRSGNSVPPDWMRLPRAIDVIPGMAKVFDFIRSSAITLKGTTLGADVSLKAYVKFLDQLIKQYGGYVDTANNAVQQLSALAGTNIQAGAGLYSFAGVGGNPYLARAVAEATSQLKFTDTHFVGGVVLVVAGPSPAVVAPVWSIIELLLGTQGKEDSIFAKALAGLNDQLSVIQAQALGDNLSPGTASSSAALEQNPADGCTPFTPTIADIKDDFTT